MRFKWLNPILVSVTISFPLFSISACGNNQQSGLPTITKTEIRRALFHEISTDDNEWHYIISVRPSIDVHLFNGSEVPYLNVDTFVQGWLQLSKEIKHGHDYKSETNNNKTIITNTFNNAQAIIDYEQQTISFDDYDAFRNCEWDTDNPLAIGIGGGDGYLYPITDSVYKKSTTPFVINFKKYNIPLYYQDNHGYIPYGVARNILEGDPDRVWFWNGHHFYEVGTNNQQTLKLYSQVKSNATVLTKDYLEFCYNSLALSLDCRFGLLERPSRANPGKIIKYFPNGAHEALKPYHDAIVSLDPDVSTHALKMFFNNEVDDGGHSGFNSINLLSTELIASDRGPEHTHTTDVKNRMRAAREKAGHGLKPDTECQVDLESSSGQNKDIAWVTMDSFDPVYFGQYIPYSEVNEENYMRNTMTLTMYLHKLVTDPNKNIKNVVLDISCNGGGAICANYFLASYLCGGTRQKMCDPVTGAYSEFTVHSNITGGDHYDPTKDKLPDNVNLYIITSNYSFSCGNMLAFSIAQNRPNTKFIGDTTGGGSCYVDSGMYVGLGSVYRSSSSYHTLQAKSTYENQLSIESGLKPEFLYMENSAENAQKFYDREFLISKMFPPQN